MKNLDTFKNDINIIAGSGQFAYESAVYLNNINRLNRIYLINKNEELVKKFKSIVVKSDIRNIEKIISSVKKDKISNVLIIGYVKFPPISEIKLSFLSKIYLKKDIYLNSINDQSLILKKFLISKKINLVSQKKIFKDFLLVRNNQIIRKDHSNLISNIKKNKKNIEKIFNLDICQSFIMNGNRILSYEDVEGTDKMIERIGKKNKDFKDLVFIKSKKKKQIDEIDFPIMGLKTIKLLKKYKFKVICSFHQKTIISKKELFLNEISKSNLSLLVL